MPKLYKPSDKPRVSEQWRLRNDQTNVIAYKCSVEKDVYKILSPLVASFIPLFDGQNSFAQIKEALFQVFNIAKDDSQAWSERFDEIFDDLMSVEGFISLQGPASISLQGDKTNLIPNFASYRYPVYRLQRPLSVAISFTNRCVADCVYCYAERKNCREADVDAWRRVFDELVQNEIYLVNLGGTDILARSDAFTILEEMVKRDFTFFLSTKSFLSERNAARLAELGIGRLDLPSYMVRPVQISIDSINEQLASFLVGRPAYLECATQSIHNLLEAGIEPRVKCVLNAYNANEMENLVAYFASRGVKEFTFVQYSRSRFRHQDELFLSLEQKRTIHEAEQRLRQRYPDLTFTIQDDLTSGGPRNLNWDKWNQRNICSGGRSHLLFQPDGDVTLCEQCPHNATFVVGNVFEHGIMGVWRSSRLLDFIYPDRSKFVGSVCYECGEFDRCHLEKGYCYRDVLSSYGTIFDAQPECPLQTRLPIREI